MQNKQNYGKKKSEKRYSDQVEYYFNYLKKQRIARGHFFSILGKHHNNMDIFIRTQIKMLHKDSKVLDAGCGLSAWTNSQIRKWYKISGVDGEPEAIEVCKKIYKGQDYRVGDLYKLSYKDRQFDAVVMREVIEHFKTPTRAVKEVARILKPRGILIITTPNYESILLHIIENTYNRFFGGPCKPYKDDVHPSKFKTKTLRKVLSHDFDIEVLKTIDLGISFTCVARKK